MSLNYRTPYERQLERRVTVLFFSLLLVLIAAVTTVVIGKTEYDAACGSCDAWRTEAKKQVKAVEDCEVKLAAQVLDMTELRERGDAWKAYAILWVEYAKAYRAWAETYWVPNTTFSECEGCR